MNADAHASSKCMRKGIASAILILSALEGPLAFPAGMREWGTFVQKIGKSIDRGLIFTDQEGRRRALLPERSSVPIVLTLAYYECPRLCSLVLNGVSDAAAKSSLRPGKDYRLLTVSIDPRETTGLAAAKQRRYLARLREQIGVPEGAWTFFTGDESSIRALAESIGFRYGKDPDSDGWIHPAGVVILTPDGRISRYLPGVRFAPADFESALREASRGSLGALANEIWLACTGHPQTGSRAARIMDGIRWFALVFLIVGSVAAAVFLPRRARPWGRRGGSLRERDEAP